MSDSPASSAKRCAGRRRTPPFPALRSLEWQGPQFWNQVARPHRQSDLSGRCFKRSSRSCANLASQLVPAIRARHIAGRVSAVPPRDEIIGIYRPARFLLTVEFFELVELFADT